MKYDTSHLVSLFEFANEGLIGTNPDGKIELINPAACRMSEFTSEELIGQQIEILIPQEYRKEHAKLREGFYEKPSNRVMGHGRDLHGVTKTGRMFPVEVSLSVYRHHNKTFVMAFIVDISHRKNIENEILRQQKELEAVSNEMRKLNEDLEMKVEERTIILREALQNLERSQQELKESLDKEKQLNEMKSSFVSMASHEFRTPLTTILSSTVLLSKYNETEQQSQRDRHIAKIKDSVKHLNTLLDDFLSLGRLDEGKVNAKISSFNVKQLVQETVDEMKRLAKDGQTIKFEHTGSEEVESDKNMIKNILNNLISNAVKFSEVGSEIRVTIFNNKGRFKLSVKDNGIGIPQDDFQHMFTSFFRSKNAQNIQGTGLGLYIVKRYVDILEGTIDMHSRLNEGTTVSISLPAKNQS